MLGNTDPAAAESGGSSGGDGGAMPESGSGGGGNRWPRQETVALIKIRTDMDVAFRDASLKGPLWDEVSRKLAELGYNRSAKKCKEKFENVFKYHKRTKDGRATKSEGKTYRFFDQLEALDTQPPPQQPPPHHQHSHQAATPATPLSMAMPATNNPSIAPPFSTANNSTTVTSTQNLPQFQIPPFSMPSTNSFPLSTFPPQSNPFSISFSAPIPTPNQNPTSVSSSSSTSSDEEPERHSSRKRKWEGFFQRLTSQVMAKQEEMQRKFLEALEKREKDRVARDEAWRAQEQARMNREREILAQERAVAAAKDAALFAFLQKVSASDQQAQNLPQGNQQNNEAHRPPQAPPPSEPLRQTPPPAPQPLALTPPPSILHTPPPQPPVSVPAPTPPAPQQQQQQQQQQQIPQSPVSAPTPVSVVPPPSLPPPTQSSHLQLQMVPSAQETRKMNIDHGGEIVNFNSNPSSSRWPKTEIEALIKLRTNLDIKYQENVPKGPLWEEISAGMLRLGYNRNAKRCKEKWENINKYYKKVKESNKKRPEDSKTCPYFSQLEAIYKERATYKQENARAPIMAQPEQQWPAQNRPELPLMEGHDSDDGMDDDDDDEDEAGNYEMVSNKPSSMGTVE